jgi:hypothetical protein
VGFFFRDNSSNQPMSTENEPTDDV